MKLGDFVWIIWKGINRFHRHYDDKLGIIVNTASEGRLVVATRHYLANSDTRCPYDSVKVHGDGSKWVSQPGKWPQTARLICEVSELVEAAPNRILAALLWNNYNEWRSGDDLKPGEN